MNSAKVMPHKVVLEGTELVELVFHFVLYQQLLYAI